MHENPRGFVSQLSDCVQVLGDRVFTSAVSWWQELVTLFHTLLT